MQEIVVGGGCFWCVEASFTALKGVESALPGYAGGQVENPSYEQVCGKQTGHAEVVKVVYDERVIQLDTLFDVFFTCHDPTTLNRQGGDVGPQYRSIILYDGPSQEQAARAAIQRFSEMGTFQDPIITSVEPLDVFWTAEVGHHDYFANNPNQPYCAAVVAPKVAKVRKSFSHLLK